MPTPPQDLTLIAVYPPREDDKPHVLGHVQFAYTHYGFDPVRIGRDYRKDDQSPWQFFEVASVPPGSVVAIRDARLIEANGQRFIAGPWRGVPVEIKAAVVTKALAALAARVGSAAAEPVVDPEPLPF